MNKIVGKLFLLIILCCVHPIFGQEAEKPIRSISVNVLAMPFNDYSIYYQSTSIKGRRLGISLGYMISNRWWEFTYFTVDDDKYPIGAYSGPEIRFSYFKLFKLKKMKIYTGPELIFKHLNYKDKWFTDWFSRDDKVPVSFKRNEETYVAGYEWIFEFDMTSNKLVPQFFVGLGGRIKFRDITTTEHRALYKGYEEERPLGFTRTRKYYPTINVGIKIALKL